MQSSVEVLAEVGRKRERLCDGLENVLFGLRGSQVRVEEVLVGVARRLHQVVNPVGPDRLDDVRTDCLQEHVAFLLFNKNFCCAHGVIR